MIRKTTRAALLAGATNGVLGAALLGAVCLSGLDGAPAYLPLPSSPSTAQETPQAPSWTPALAREFPGCQINRGRLLSDTVVVILPDGAARRMNFDRAWKIVHNASAADDLWIVGVCA